MQPVSIIPSLVLVLYINSGLTPSPFIWFISPIKQFGWHNTLRSLFFPTQNFRNVPALPPATESGSKEVWDPLVFLLNRQRILSSFLKYLNFITCFGVRCFLWDSLEHGVLFQWGFILSFQQDVSHLSVACFQLLCLFFFLATNYMYVNVYLSSYDCLLKN